MSRYERPRAWVRPFRHLHRALDASTRLIAASLAAASRSERRAHRRPIGSSRNLLEAEARLETASVRLGRAARALAETNECLGRDPECAPDLPQLLIEAAQRWVFTAAWLQDAAHAVFTLHADVLEGIALGTLIPERPRERRPRIILAPRPAPVRAFLAARQPRAADRISPVLRRRRRTPRPAAVSVPRRTAQGRAPPLSLVCPL
jgi:hypothetical protein